MPSGNDGKTRDGFIRSNAKAAEGSSVGGRLAYARAQAELLITQVANLLETTPAVVERWESNQLEPGSSNLTRLAGIFGVNPAWLLTGAGPGPEAGSRSEGFSEAGAGTADQFFGMSEDGKQFLEKDAVRILRRIAVWTGNEGEALAWYRTYPIVEFGDRTAESLVKSGQTDALLDYLDSVAAGNFQ